MATAGREAADNGLKCLALAALGLKADASRRAAAMVEVRRLEKAAADLGLVAAASGPGMVMALASKHEAAIAFAINQRSDASGTGDTR